MDNDSVKDNIRNFRKIHQLTQAEMADKLGISRTAYRNIEMGDTRLISESIPRIADILDIRAEDLVLGYSPDKRHGGKDSASRQIAEINRIHKEEVEKLTAEIARLENEIRLLQQNLDTQKELTRTKDEIIDMMKKLDSRGKTD